MPMACLGGADRSPIRFKDRLGFTLAEVLVVSTIIAILAAVAIPVYTGYVRSQRQAVVENLAQTAAVAANAWYRRHNTDPTIADLNLFMPVEGKFHIFIEGANIIVRDTSASPIAADTLNYR
jgi:prepilin-type N-terminal cleavage/methylation domain-containing protein